MMTRGPKRKVTRARTKRVISFPGNSVSRRWDLILECGHAVERPLKKGGQPPDWVYCGECLSEGRNAR